MIHRGFHSIKDDSALYRVPLNINVAQRCADAEKSDRRKLLLLLGDGYFTGIKAWNILVEENEKMRGGTSQWRSFAKELNQHLTDFYFHHFSRFIAPSNTQLSHFFCYRLFLRLFSGDKSIGKKCVASSAIKFCRGMKCL